MTKIIHRRKNGTCNHFRTHINEYILHLKYQKFIPTLFSRKHEEIVKDLKISLFSHFPSIQKTGWLVLLSSPYEISTIQAFAYTIQTFYLYYILDQPVFLIEGKAVKIKVTGQ